MIIIMIVFVYSYKAIMSAVSNAMQDVYSLRVLIIIPKLLLKV